MKTKYLMQAAIIAAIYATLTLVLSPISYGPLQIRVAEALTILPAITPAGVPGIFIGCLVSNSLGPYGLLDIVFGSLASLIAAFATFKLRKFPALAPLPPVIINGIIIGGMLHYGYGVPNLLACILWISGGQAIVCYLLGFPLLGLLRRYEGILR